MSATEAGGEIKGCPFCGGIGEMQDWSKWEWNECYFIRCRDCCADMQGQATPEGALAAWNRRAADPGPAGGPRCTCDDNSDYPCQVHRRENQLQDERDEAIAAKEKAEADLIEAHRATLRAKAAHVDDLQALPRRRGGAELVIEAAVAYIKARDAGADPAERMRLGDQLRECLRNRGR